MTTASIVEEIAARAAGLPFELQRETLHFIEFIAQREKNGVTTASQQTVDATELRPPLKSVIGSLEHLNVHVTTKDIADARGEMWGHVTEHAISPKPQPPIRNVIGLYDHLGINLSDDDITEARREMWGNFPREEPR